MDPGDEVRYNVKCKGHFMYVRSWLGFHCLFVQLEVLVHLVFNEGMPLSNYV